MHSRNWIFCWIFFWFVPVNGTWAFDSGMCRVQDSIHLEIFIDTPLCAGQLATLTMWATGGIEPFQYSTDGGLNFSQNVVFNLLAGTYILVAKDAEECVKDTVLTIHQPEPLHLLIGQDTFTAGAGEVINLLALGSGGSPPLMFSWSPAQGLSCSDCPNPTVVAGMVNSYTVVLSDKNGCSRSLSVAFDITSDTRIFIPTAFSPDQNGLNDLFQVYGSGNGVFEVDQLQVWDRWGGLIWMASHFNLNDPATGWDGTFRGQKLDPGVFIFTVQIRFLDGSLKRYKGEFTLIR